MIFDGKNVILVISKSCAEDKKLFHGSVEDKNI
jgi:hypothetical protein